MTPQQRKRRRLARQALAVLLVQIGLLVCIIGLIAGSFLFQLKAVVIVPAMLVCGILGMLAQAYYEVRIWPQQDDLRRDDEV